MGENAQIKDSLFVDLFQKDIDGKRNFLSLYNALSEKNLIYEETKIEPKVIEQVAYHTLYNDVSMLVNNKLIVLIEHQSTVNKNMPLRFLLYVARLYESIVDMADRYKSRLVKIPTPEFYVIYNGTDDCPAVQTLQLKDAYQSSDSQPMLNLTVKVFNMEKRQKLTEIIQKCKVLDDYCQFIDLIREHNPKKETDIYKKVIKRALEIGLLQNYLDRKVSEVVNMLIAEYDYATDIAVQREESYQDGFEAGEKKGEEQGEKKGAYETKIHTAKLMKDDAMPIESIIRFTGLSEQEIMQL